LSALYEAVCGDFQLGTCTSEKLHVATALHSTDPRKFTIDDCTSMPIYELGGGEEGGEDVCGDRQIARSCEILRHVNRAEIMKRKNNVVWTEEDDAVLRRCIESHTTPVRTAVTLKRTVQAVKDKARRLGLRFMTMREHRLKLTGRAVDPTGPPTG
jgi:hypothetical protein